MKYIDNDMDELFNKAGHDYPLNTDKKNWDAVKGALDSHEASLPPATPRNRKKYYPLLLLLFVPAFLLVFNNVQDTGKGAPGANSVNQSAGALEKPKENGTTNSVSTGETDLQAGGNGKKAPVPANVNDGQVPTIPENEEKVSPVMADEKENTINKKRLIEQPVNTSVQAKNNNSTTGRDPLHIPVVRGQNTSGEPGENINGRQLFENETSQSLYLLKTFGGIPSPFRINDAENPSDAIKNDPRARALTAPADSNQAEKKQIVKKKKRVSSVYYGIIAGPDFSSIKSQEIKNVGSGAGVLLGYRFSKRWSAEISGIWGSKKYYTDGKYFDKSAAQIPWSVDIYYLNGGCNMIEVPLNVRYLFSPHKNTFFLTAGFNSYFMKKEKYTYKADANGMVYDGYRKYTNSGNHFFSNLQLSAGYQYKLFDKIQIRVEPYLQVPLRHVGIGKMPITSAGVHFGLMREKR